MLLGIPSGSRSSFAYGGVTLCADAFQASSATQTISYFLPDQQLWLAGPTTPITQRLPAMTRDRFGLFPFRSPLLRESLLLSLPVGTEMFHFPTFPLPALYIQAGVTGSARRPAGFPHSETLGSKCAYPLPEAYRRLLRPSSAPDAKASTVCSSKLDHIHEYESCLASHPEGLRRRDMTNGLK